MQLSTKLIDPILKFYKTPTFNLVEKEALTKIIEILCEEIETLRDDLNQIKELKS